MIRPESKPTGSIRSRARPVPVLSAFVLSAALAAFGSTAQASQQVFFLDQDDAITSGAACGSSAFVEQAYGEDYATCRRDGSVLATGPVLRLRTPSSLDPSGDQFGGGAVFRAYARWTAGGNRCSNVRVEVRRNNGASLVLSRTFDFRPIDDSVNWVEMGSFTAIVGQNYEVTYYANNAIGGAGTGIGCFMTPDAALFVKETYDTSDITDLNSGDIVDEPGIEFSTAGSRSVSASPAVNTCSSYSVLTSFSVSVPASPTSSYVRCSATGEAFLGIADRRIAVGIDDTTGTSVPDRQRSLETDADVAGQTWEGYRQWAVQNVYTVPSSTTTTFRTFALKACREDSATTGTVSWDPLICEVFPTRR